MSAKVKTTAQPSARETAFHEIELVFPYATALIDELKTEVPARHRRWDAEDRVWRITDPFKETAVALLLTHFSDAEIPEGYTRPPHVTTKPAPSVPIRLVPPKAIDQTEPDPLIVCIGCPRCGAQIEQAIRPIVETSSRVAKRERTPPELIVTCSNPACRDPLVLWFSPALLPLQEAS